MHHKPHPTRTLILFLTIPVLSCFFTSCAEDENQGDLVETPVYIYGESFIEEKIPASEFVDGWNVEFDVFALTLKGVGLDGGGEWSQDQHEALYIDLAKQAADQTHDGHYAGWVLVTTSNVYDSAYYSIAPSNTGSNANVNFDDLEKLKSGDTSLIVKGTASKDSQFVNFEWSFKTDASYSQCMIEPFTPVKDSNTSHVQLTIHGDHLFADSFGEGAELRFQPFFEADSDDNGVITNEELDAVDITSTSMNAGGDDTITTLQDFIAAQARNIGHINGEGHCNIIE